MIKDAEKPAPRSLAELEVSKRVILTSGLSIGAATLIKGPIAAANGLESLSKLNYRISFLL